MRKKLFSILLAISMLATFLVVPAYAAEPAENSNSPNIGAHWFYDQLDDNAKKIYDVLYEMYSSGSLKEGNASRDLVEAGAVDQAMVDAYVGGDKALFDAFSAAKDAFDLDLSEVWYLDSSYLCLRTAKKEDGTYTVSIGPGRAKTYYIQGLTGSEDVDEKDKQVERVIREIVSEAKKQDTNGLSESDKTAKQVRYVHDRVTKLISYRFENECEDGNAPYIRTLYALVTHEGVCEAYSRAMQVILTRLNIPCVLVHGIQNSGTPEMHMWNEVKIGNEWYAIDATWDDPVKYDKNTGKLVDGNDGDDGREHRTYLMVGMDVIGQDWLKSGIVSAGQFEFEYPELAIGSYSGDSVYEDDTGLHVTYTSMKEIEGSDAGMFTVSFNGKGVQKAADEDGLYLLIKMYDEHQDGTVHQMEDWYYAAAALYLLNHDNASQYFYDADDGLRLCTATCEYVEFAMTTLPPDNYKNYSDFKAWGAGEISKTRGEAGFYHGDSSDIFAKTDKLYNAESKYEAAPYVLSQTPAGNKTHTAGYEYHVSVRWDDVLYHPTSADDEGPVKKTSAVAAVAAALDDDREAAAASPIQVKYTPWQLDRDGKVVVAQLSQYPSCDKNGDRIVENVEYHFLTEQCSTHKDAGTGCSVEAGCPFDGVDFDFKSSDKWADDEIDYDFQLYGVVGSRSFRIPNNFDLTMVCPGECPACYRSQGIDWNLWGKPTLLDNPDDLDLSKVIMEGVDGHRQTLEDLQKDMKVDDLNGRLTLVVEPIGEGQGSREKYNEVTGAFEKFEDETGIDPQAIQSSAMYEITFTRLCKMIMLETGQSLRMQMGFPQGFDADSPVVYKAYHFTRCSEEQEVKGNHCPNKNEVGHAWGDDIVSVEEIPIAVTPYGLVILCDSFSPFEIVALDADSVQADDLVKEHNIVVKTDGNGSVLCDGVDASGANGFVAFEKDEAHVFTVTPKAGYAIDTVAFGGQAITVKENSFVLTYDEVVDTNDVLNVAFVPEAIQEAEKEQGLTSVTPAVTASACQHTRRETIEKRDPTCTDIGYTQGERCADCHLVLTPSEPIEALGHTYVNHYCERCGHRDPGYHPFLPSDKSTEYGITVKAVPRGTVTASAESAVSGEIITLTVTPDPCFALESIGVHCDLYGVVVDVKKSEDGTYTFIMPAGDVEITAVFGPKGGQVTELPFTDADKGRWSFDSIAYVYSCGIMRGISKTQFAPAKAITRAQIVTMLWNLEGKPTVEADEGAPKTAFPDVAAGTWYEDAIAWACTSGLAKGYDDGKFMPDASITREQLVTILYRYAKFKGYSLTINREESMDWPDAHSVSAYAIEAMRWACEHGLIHGTDLGTLEPRNCASREQAATIFTSFLNGVEVDEEPEVLLMGLPDGDVPDVMSAVLYDAAVGDKEITSVALSQVGNSGDKYWQWYGFGSRVEWCACFVSWCANQCGLIKANVIPLFSSCLDGVEWFQAHDLWQGGDYTPCPGDIIFFDWDYRDSGQNGLPDHVGIVEEIEDDIIVVVEGNSGDMCRVQQYEIGNYEILGYGTPFKLAG